jgi:hypothetical protein
MPWNPSPETQALMRDPAIARLIADALRRGASRVTLPDGRVVELVPVVPA